MSLHELYKALEETVKEISYEYVRLYKTLPPDEQRAFDILSKYIVVDLKTGCLVLNLPKPTVK